MKTLLVAIAALSSMTAPTMAMSPRIVASLKEMDLATRFEQRCVIEAMNRIPKEHSGLRPDEMVVYAFGRPEVKGNVMVAKGAAFRSGNVWHRIDFRCKTSSDRMKIISFTYKIGDTVPREKWSGHYLVPQ